MLSMVCTVCCLCGVVFAIFWWCKVLSMVCTVCFIWGVLYVVYVVSVV